MSRSGDRKAARVSLQLLSPVRLLISHSLLPYRGTENAADSAILPSTTMMRPELKISQLLRAGKDDVRTRCRGRLTLPSRDLTWPLRLISAAM